jgi:serine/threonine-protein kinase
MPSPDRGLASIADRYRVERPLGAGGMATVYLAHDIRHDRKVALKVLRPELAAVLGAQRFLAEIKTTANLQHPHIVPLHDSGEIDGTVFYVMPFVEGESVRDRLARENQLPVGDAVRIAREVAAALDYAHRRGVIHRDIKPENILLHEGRALVADFGIALAASRADGIGRLTETGISLGTPHYMSPEQALGERNLDGRTDVYALGCVLYEMLAGEPPFTGPTSQAVLARVMNDDAEPVTSRRKSVPRHVAAAVATAIQRLPADRFSTAAELDAALSDPAFGGASPAGGTWFPLRDRRVRVFASIVAVVSAAAGAGLTRLLSPSGASDPTVVRFDLPLPDSTALGVGPRLFSPLFPAAGGRLLRYASGKLYERHLSSPEERVLREDPGALSPSIEDDSPDGTALLVIWTTGGQVSDLAGPGPPGARTRVFGGHLTLNVVPIDGGPSRVVADSANFATWGSDGFIYFSYFWPRSSKIGVARVAETGGAVDTLATFDTGVVPQNLTLLPDGKGLVVAIGTRQAPTLSVLDLRDTTWHDLGPGGPTVQWADPGYLLYTSGSAVVAARFDRSARQPSGPPRPLVTVPDSSVRFVANADIVTFIGLGSSAARGPRLVIRSRAGETRALPNLLPGWRFTGPEVAPDGRRFVVEGVQQQSGPTPTPPPQDVFVYELPSGPMTRLRSEKLDSDPTWLPGGRDIGFLTESADTLEAIALVRQRWDGSEPPTAVFTQAGVRFGLARWLPDGRGILVRYGIPGPTTSVQNASLGLIRTDRPDSIVPVVTGTSGLQSLAVSPDGRLVAYASDETSRFEVWVRRLDGEGRRQVSLRGGVNPRWARSGRELFFEQAGNWFAAPIDATGEIRVGRLTPLFGNMVGAISPLPGDTLFVGALSESDSTRGDIPVNVLVHLTEALRRLTTSR